MSFLGMGTPEILIVLLLAFIFLGPQRMVEAARMLGKLSREMRKMTSEVTDMVTEEMNPLEQSRTVSGNRRTANDGEVKSNDEARPDTEEREPSVTDGSDGPVPYQRTSRPTAKIDSEVTSPEKEKQQTEDKV